MVIPNIVRSHTWEVKDSLVLRSKVNEALLIVYGVLAISSFVSKFSRLHGWNVTAWRMPWTFLFDGGETQTIGTSETISTAIATRHLVRKWNLPVSLTYSISHSRHPAAWPQPCIISGIWVTVSLLFCMTPNWPALSVQMSTIGHYCESHLHLLAFPKCVLILSYNVFT